MKINWWILTIFFILAIALIVFLIRQNRKDEKEFEHQIDEDYKKPKVDEPKI